MSAEANKQLVQNTYAALFNSGDLAIADELVSADFVNHDAPPHVPGGPEGLRQMVVILRTAFPDLRYEIKEVIGQGDWVAVRTILYGTHNGPFFGIAPSGRQVVQEQMHLIRFANGKGVEHHAVRDDLGLLRQMGVIPDRT
jgi:predicted ester cyclase